jgi:hypothetical protein
MIQTDYLAIKNIPIKSQTLASGDANLEKRNVAYIHINTVVVSDNCLVSSDEGNEMFADFW